jgi:pyrroline-5-carboxylate reductase
MKKIKKIGFLGGGNMAEALMKGLIMAKLVTPSNVIASDVLSARRKHLSSTLKVKTTDNNQEVVKNADVIFIAVKPNIVDPLLSEVGALITSSQLVISIAAGIPTTKIEKKLSADVPVIRVMPNTPALILEGASALAGGASAKKEHIEIAHSLLGAVGKVIIVSESQLNAVTGLSGSGPAYVFQFIESLADGGVKEGLSRENALLLAAQTVYGSVKMLLKTEEHPASLRDKVTSPGGTTIAGLHALESGKFGATVMNAVSAATHRSKELSSGNK